MLSTVMKNGRSRECLGGKLGCLLGKPAGSEIYLAVELSPMKMVKSPIAWNI